RRELAPRWAAATAATVVTLAPLLWFGMKQRHQVAFITRVGITDTGTVLSALFGSLLVAVVVIALAAYGLPLRWPQAADTTWALVRVFVLVVVSLVTPLLLPRYLIFTLPAWALLAGVALARRHVAMTAAGVALVAALGVPAQLEFRDSDGHAEATRAAAGIVA